MLSTGERVPSTTALGASIPRLGFGTWQLRGEACARLVAEAIAAGYTHIDTAQGYANEEFVGEGIGAAGAPRGGLFVTTKVRPDRMAEGDLERSLEESLRKLRLDRVDLLLLHWPNPEIPLAGTIRALNRVRRAGLARHIGLSNFTRRLLDEAWRLTEEPLVAEQIEYHPFLDQHLMRDALRARRMALIAYSPIALGKVVGDPVIEQIARTHGRTAAQVALRWLMQQDGVVAIPKTSRVERLRENLAIFDFALTDAEMALIDALRGQGLRLINEPQWVPLWD